MTALLELRDIRRSYPSGDGSVEVLKGITLSIHAGEMVAIVGASGSGKSTLMNILGCLDKPTSGTYRVAGTDIAQLDGDALARLRREHFGFIFQRYHLLSHLTAAQNVEVPAVYAGSERRARLARAHELLVRLGLGERADYQPSQLSGGPAAAGQYRPRPDEWREVILADEPTGALDSHSGEEVMAILHQLKAAGAHGHHCDPRSAGRRSGGADRRDPRWRDRPQTRPPVARAADCAPVRRRSLRRGVSLPAAFAKRW
ncbi:macrolide export ATP-binding/permease MacB [Klebsiella pneumoniae]|uniref:Macrolide export ATP-binding/permease MacB n=1 Tax=Klebsiella pneumoniae TaxID=573 RepID=A0A377XPB8_KLEPN|nr:macrolide export ATP-binding/permease MacB [Klebsiella pneumoniae]